MATITLNQLRQAVQAQLQADLTGWTASRYAAAWFGADSRALAHRAFAVGVVATQPDPMTVQRQRPGAGHPLRTLVKVVVRWSWRLRGDAHVADQDAALAAADQVLQSVMSMSTFHRHFTGSTFEGLDAQSQAYLLAEQRFDFHINRALQ